MLLVFFIILTLLGTVFVFIDPLALKKRGRDNKRLSDIMVLERMVTEYRIDNGSYPDDESVVRTSSVATGSLYLSDVSGGWLAADLRQYNSKLPIDPQNTNEFVYTYTHSATAYEINCSLEYYSEKLTEDGGNSNSKYEVGSDLTLM